MSEPACERPGSAPSWADHVGVLLAGAGGGYLSLALLTANLFPAVSRPGGAGEFFCGASLGLLTGYLPGLAALVEIRGRRGGRILAVLAATASGAFFCGLATAVLAIAAHR
jgi:hypothetical protein